jgi:carbon storage regulator CsrA
MLILARRLGESIQIDNVDSVESAEPGSVPGVKGNQVRAGIAAPPDIAIVTLLTEPASVKTGRDLDEIAAEDATEAHD